MEQEFGKRDARGNWKPTQGASYPPVFVWPVRIWAFLTWLPSYLFTWNLFYAAVAGIAWLWLTPSAETSSNLAIGWIALIAARNAAFVFLFAGGFHLWLYWLKRQGTEFKFNATWPDRRVKAFIFDNQTLDNMVWTFASAVPIWTTFEILMLWAWSNGWLPMVDPREAPIWSLCLLILIPLWRDLHFYAVHRLLHWPPLYKLAHHQHHKNVNPGPWSGLSMHPIEHLLYFSCVLIHLVVPSHAIHIIFTLMHAGLSPAPGHAGFDRLIIKDGKTLLMPCYAHYLHHKYFECNYADGVVPLDRWFGSFHDGSDEAQAAMQMRRATMRV